MPPSLVVVAWAAFGSSKVAREFLADGARGLRGIKPGLPVVVVGGENDGEACAMLDVLCTTRTTVETADEMYL